MPQPPHFGKPSLSPPPAVWQGAFTVDVEDYYQVDAFSDRVHRDQWHTFESRVLNSTRRLLDLMAAANVRGTFFVLGHIAQLHPELVQEICDAGHELGCHGYWHRSVHRMTPAEFREDMQEATKLLEDLSGRRVVAFRAPNFSIREQTWWALEILAELGYTIDSSIFPVRHDRYGMPSAPREPHLLNLPAGPIWEFPPTVYRWMRMNIPVSGGGYFRLFPYAFSRHCLQRVSRNDGLPLMFYIHPWELDPEQPRLPASWKSRFRHYQNLRWTAPRLQRLFADLRFGTLSDVLNEWQVRHAGQETPLEPGVSEVSINSPEVALG